MPRFIKKSAFSIIEIIVVLFIISIGLIGILSLIVQNIQSQNYNQGNLIAYQLSQEGVELIRRLRDTNWNSSQDFNTDLAPAPGTVYNYYMDYNDALPTEVFDAKPRELKMDSDGFYIHDSVSPTASSTGFSRLISVELLDADRMRVSSGVYWQNNGRNYSYIVETLLYDWF